MMYGKPVRSPIDGYKRKVIQWRVQGDIPHKEIFIKKANMLDKAIKSYEKGQITRTYLADYYVSLINM